jgi:hypothetical protein
MHEARTMEHLTQLLEVSALWIPDEESANENLTWWVC